MTLRLPPLPTLPYSMYAPSDVALMLKEHERAVLDGVAAYVESYGKERVPVIMLLDFLRLADELRGAGR